MAIDRSFITLLEAVDKRTRITSTGGEIITTFYVEPASGAPIVVSRLLGSVTGDSPASYARNLPAADYDYPFYYCVEAHPTPFDRRSVTSSPAMLLRQYGGASITASDIDDALAKPIIFDGPQTVNPDGTRNPQNSPNMCGAYVEAVYRPLNSIYNGSTGGANAARAFDYIDPQMYPCSRTIPMGAGLVIAAQGKGTRRTMTLDGTSALKVDTWHEFTIRRVMCPSVPWDTIRQLTSRINGLRAWTPANMTVPGLPGNTFDVGTLRFDSAEPILRVVPTCVDSNGKLLGYPDTQLPTTTKMQWWDILYKFSWRTTFDYWHDDNGVYVNGGKPAQLTWNVEWNPTASTGLYVSYVPGWYEAYFSISVADNTITATKYPNAEDPALPLNAALPAGAIHPFDALFLLNAK